MLDLLNDPKTDEYALPLGVLKKARCKFKAGQTCEEIAKGILGFMHRTAVKKPNWLDRFPVLSLPKDDQLTIVMSRLEMADPNSPEQKNYQRLLRRFTGRKYHKKAAENMTPEERAVYLAKKREYTRRHLENNPEARERNREYSRDRQNKLKEEDLDAYLEYHKNYREKLRSTPEGRARMKENMYRGIENRKKRMAEDPWYREKQLQYRRNWAKRNRAAQSTGGA